MKKLALGLTREESEVGWEYFEGFLQKEAADRMCSAMLNMSWLVHPDDSRGYGDGAYAMYFGKSFRVGGSGGRVGERPEIPPGWRKLADKVADKINCPVNYIQCHRYAPSIPVTPHHDPAGMVVPMLVLGQERTFRVGGKMDSNLYKMPQGKRPVEGHHPKDEILLRHGSLLVFNGGRTLHSMFPAAQDRRFNPNGFDWRISVLFRWTTDSMRKFGPGQGASRDEYMGDIEKWRAERAA